MEKTCSCSVDKKTRPIKESASVFSIILVALVPKCPVCVLSYSSAIAMCGSSGVTGPVADWSLTLSVIMACTTLFLVLFNYKGKRTLWAAGLILIGSMFMLLAKLHTGWILDYYIGTLFLLLGVWVNGSFRYFYKRFFRPAWEALASGKSE